MPSMDRFAGPALALVAVGVALVGAGVLLFPNAGDPAYSHSVESISADEIPDGANVTNYSDLSPEGKAAFTNALESPDGYHVVREEAEKPPEFFYSDYSTVNRGIYVIRYEGSYYRLSTAASGGFGFVAYGIKLSLGLVGALLALVGGVSVVREDERTPVAVWGGLVGASVVLLVRPLAAGLVRALPVALAAFAVSALLAYRYWPAIRGSTR